ncbi:hypothetical protein BDU57DRAFT_597645 [Ampelomyces quisqualis]|uniref:Piwi domain-containing protein n=1 Tax=Ampelomyces quisqualis TaxID=50730 RepID=A0A6A5QGS9_AMPQU|nr:hypothetical protein BDU57DRAFT_597645 [Ampelomyces quisqualis]
MADASSDKKGNNRSKPSSASSVASQDSSKCTKTTASSSTTVFGSDGNVDDRLASKAVDRFYAKDFHFSGAKTILPIRGRQTSAGGPASGEREHVSKVSNTPAPVAGKEVVKMPKPHSRTAIGQVSQRLKSLPGFFIVDLTFYTSVGGEEKAINSRKLRQRALKAWLKECMTSHPALSANVERQPGVVRLIFHVNDESGQTNMKDWIEEARSKVFELKDETTGTSGNKNITITWDFHFQDTTKAYKKSLDLVLRQTTHKMKDLELLPLAPNCNSVFDPVLPGCLRSTSSARPTDYRFHLRHRPSADISEKQLKVDFDVVPCIPSKNLAEVLLDMVGRTGLNEPNLDLIQSWLPTIRNSLRGVNVRCAYVPGKKTSQGRDKAELLVAGNMEKGRRFQIQDIRLPAEVAEFDVGLESYTIYEYFSKVVLQDRTDELGLNDCLPLVQDPTGAWIPVQMLNVVGPQLLTRYGHLNSAIGTVTRDFVKQDGYARLFDISARILRDFPAIASDFEAIGAPGITGGLASCGLAKLTRSLVAVSEAPAPVQKRNLEPFPSRTLYQPVTCNAKIAIIYQRSWSTAPSDHILISKVRHGLTSISNAVSGDTIELDFGPLSEGLRLDCDLAFAIVDDTAQTEGHTRKALARLHDYFDRKAGVLLVCATYSHLEKLFKGALVPSDKYFPASLRAKINYKLGGVNRTTGLAQLVSDTGLMIAGGHISHYKTQNHYRPSISAVVASVDTQCQQYLGSVRIHSDVLTKKGAQPGVKPGLSRLWDMMIERFRQCSQLDPPTKLLFFRDSKDFGDNAKDFKLECHLIRDAYDEVFRHNSTIQIIYVVVNKNTEYRLVDTQHDNGSTIPKLNYIVEDASTAKYRYYVVENEPNWSKEYLTTLTRHINQSSQLSTPADTLSNPLPLTLAKKLCARTSSYIHDYPSFAVRRHDARDTRQSAALEQQYHVRVAGSVELALDVVGATETLLSKRLLPWSARLDHYMFYL